MHVTVHVCLHTHDDNGTDRRGRGGRLVEGVETGRGRGEGGTGGWVGGEGGLRACLPPSGA